MISSFDSLKLPHFVTRHCKVDFNFYFYFIFLYLFVQVAVALSHAAILEESMRARDQLMEQNVALDLARREAEMAIRARNDFLAVMNHEMRIPMHAIIALSSILLGTELTPEQRVMLEIILKSSNLLSTLISDVLDLSKLEDGSLELDTATFNLHGVFREVLLSLLTAFLLDSVLSVLRNLNFKSNKNVFLVL